MLHRRGAAIGTNKRYPDHALQLRDARIMREGTPLTLTKRELELDVEPMTRPPAAIEVEAWVRYKTPLGDIEAIYTRALLTAWTRHACAIKWETESGEHRAWVWDSAVRSAAGPGRMAPK